MASRSGVIRLMCPNLKCRAVLAVPPESRGRLVRCKACGSSIRVPLKRDAQSGTETPVDETNPESGTAA